MVKIICASYYCHAVNELLIKLGENPRAIKDYEERCKAVNVHRGTWLLESRKIQCMK